MPKATPSRGNTGKAGARKTAAGKTGAAKPAAKGGKSGTKKTGR